MEQHRAQNIINGNSHEKRESLTSPRLFGYGNSVGLCVGRTYLLTEATSVRSAVYQGDIADMESAIRVLSL